MRPVTGDRDRGNAPVSAEPPEWCFWDHLGATRAEEYAAEDIAALRPEPVAMPDRDALPPRPGGSGPVAQADAKPTVTAGAAQPNSARPAPAADAAAMHPGTDAAAFRAVASRRARQPMPRKPVSGARSRRARLSYRLQRIWLTPLYRALLTRGLPLLLVIGGCALVLANAQNRAQIVSAGQAAYAAVVDRPEFMVSKIVVSPVAPELERAIRARLAQELPRSSFRLDLPALRADIEAYDSVAEAALRLGADGTMLVTVKERAPVVVWHSGMGRQLLDIDGHRVAKLADTAEPPDLPLIAGDGASDHVPEALALLDAAQPVGERLRGLVRVSTRRWDVVLDRSQRIRLPERGAMQALERVLALDDVEDLLARDVPVVDMRNPSRPVLQVSPGALETLRAIKLTPSAEASP